MANEGFQNGKCGKRRARQPDAEQFEYGDWGAVYGVSETEEYVEAGARRCKGSTFAVRLSSVLPRKKENTDIFAGIQNKMCNFVSDI